jgi:hypothetical protein
MKDNTGIRRENMATEHFGISKYAGREQTVIGDDLMPDGMQLPGRFFGNYRRIVNGSHESLAKIIGVVENLVKW